MSMAEIIEMYVAPPGEASVGYLDHDPEGFVEPPVDPGGFEDDDAVRGYVMEG
jgi:hypothetical protein